MGRHPSGRDVPALYDRCLIKRRAGMKRLICGSGFFFTPATAWVPGNVRDAAASVDCNKISSSHIKSNVESNYTTVFIWLMSACSAVE